MLTGKLVRVRHARNKLVPLYVEPADSSLKATPRRPIAATGVSLARVGRGTWLMRSAPDASLVRARHAAAAAANYGGPATPAPPTTTWESTT